MKSFWKCDVCVRFELDIEAENQDEAAEQALRQGAALVLSGSAPLNRLTAIVNAENGPVRVIDLSADLLLFQAPKNHRLSKELVEFILEQLQTLSAPVYVWEGVGCPTLLVQVPWKKADWSRAFLKNLSENLEAYWQKRPIKDFDARG